MHFDPRKTWHGFVLVLVLVVVLVLVTLFQYMFNIYSNAIVMFQQLSCDDFNWWMMLRFILFSYVFQFGCNQPWPTFHSFLSCSFKMAQSDEDWWSSGEWRKLCVGGDMENICIPVDTVAWCWYRGDVWLSLGGSLPNRWTKHTKKEEKHTEKAEKHKKKRWLHEWRLWMFKAKKMSKASDDRTRTSWYSFGAGCWICRLAYCDFLQWYKGWRPKRRARLEDHWSPFCMSVQTLCCEAYVWRCWICRFAYLNSTNQTWNL